MTIWFFDVMWTLMLFGVALFTAAYTMFGGIKAVVWTDVVQGTVLILGGSFVLIRLLFAPEAGAPFAVVGEPAAVGKGLVERWGSIATRLTLYAPYPHDRAVWPEVMAAMRA